jgi:hypothetical protein
VGAETCSEDLKNKEVVSCDCGPYIYIYIYIYIFYIICLYIGHFVSGGHMVCVV